MRHLRIGVGTVVGVTLAVACSSSSNKAPAEAGVDSSTSTVTDSGPPSVPCNMTAGSPLCGTGMTCCTPGLDLASLASVFTGGGAASLANLIPTPSCVPTGSCTPTPDGGVDAGAEAGAEAGVGLALGGGAFAGGNLSLGTSTACQASCKPGQQQRCASDRECTGGQTCEAPLGFAGLPGFAGGGEGGNPLADLFGGDGGNPFGDLFGGGDDAGAAMYCSPPDAGTGPDAGTSDAAAVVDAGASDAAIVVDTGTVSEASSTGDAAPQ